ncbi:1933_t:CDS:1, partial [Gigaspora rosea]
KPVTVSTLLELGVAIFLSSKNAINWLSNSFDNHTLVILGLHNAGQPGLLVVACNQALDMVFEEI